MFKFSSVVQSCSILCDPMDRSTLGFPVHQLPSLLKLMIIKSVMPANLLILWRPLLLLPSIFPSISVFSESALCRVAKELELQDWFPLQLTDLIFFDWFLHIFYLLVNKIPFSGIELNTTFSIKCDLFFPDIPQSHHHVFIR